MFSFLQKIKRDIALKKLKFLILIPIVLLIFQSCNRTPNDIFVAIFEELPKSVKVHHGQDQYPLDCCLWVHFSIDKKEDYNRIIKQFEEKELDYDKWKYVMPPNMNWWKPNKFGEKGIYMVRETETETEGIYLNEDKTEVFYVNYLK